MLLCSKYTHCRYYPTVPSEIWEIFSDFSIETYNNRIWETRKIFDNIAIGNTKNPTGL